MSQPIYIGVAGNIGCGKSTLVDFICRRYGLQPFFEPNAENPYLSDFYADMKRWAFHSQISFLSKKFCYLQDLESTRKNVAVVQDRTIYEDAEVFARYLHRQGFMAERDWGVYSDLYKSLLATLRPPDLIIYLRASVKTIRRRVRLRARPEEQAIPASYLQQLNELYEEWFAAYALSPTIVIDTEHLNYLEDWIDQLELHHVLGAYLFGEGRKLDAG